jgi:hypothetical protein
MRAWTVLATTALLLMAPATAWADPEPDINIKISGIDGLLGPVVHLLGPVLRLLGL